MTQPTDRRDASALDADAHATLGSEPPSLSQAPTRRADSPESPEDGTLAIPGQGTPRRETPLDQTLALPGDPLPGDPPPAPPPPPRAPAEPGYDTLAGAPVSIERPTENLHATIAPAAVAPGPPPPDQTLALPGESPRPTQERSLGGSTEFLTQPGNTHQPPRLDQTLNDASLPSAAPTEGHSRGSVAPTAPGSPGAAARQARRDRDTAPLSAVAPDTRHGHDPASHAPTRLAIQPTHDSSGARLPTIPGYVILEELGRGGMGVVYKARQEKLGRLVALKMIRSGANASGEDLRRFRAEAEAVAALQHPNIVQIYEIGEIEDMPFFSLEYIDGGSLHQRLKNDTSLPAREAAELVEALARAMHHAHQHGIVHRDLKPANILLQPADGAARPGNPERSTTFPPWQATLPKITDFGLAKHLEKDTGHTREGSILGTPSYMAPEQAEGKNSKIGPPCDIYALGAILYDLLASRPPFRGETLMDTLKQVINTDPLPPTHLQPNLSRDLETICLKCLQKEPEKRYATAQDLADDLKRFLNGEPIQARATPWWEKAAKWARRRPAAAALIAVLLLTVVGVVAGSALYAAEKSEQAARESALREQAVAAQRLAEENEVKERQQRERADELALREQDARRRADRRAFDALVAVERVLTMADETLEHIPQFQPIRERLLGESVHFLRRFHRDNQNDPELREHVAFGQKRLAEIFLKRGDTRDAEQAYRESLTLFRGLVKEHPGNREYLRNLAILAEQLAVCLQERNNPAEAGPLFDQAIETLGQVRQSFPDEQTTLALLTGLLSSPARASGAGWQTVWDMVTITTWAAEREKLLEALALAHLHRGTFRQTQGQIPPARTDYLQAHALFVELARLNSGEHRYQYRLGALHNGLGTSLAASGDLPGSRKDFDAAVRILDGLVGSQGEVASYRAELAYAHRYRGQVDFLTAQSGPAGEAAREQAGKDLQRSIALLDRLSRDYPRNPEYTQQLVESHSALGKCYQFAQQPARALKAWQDALAVLERLPPRLRNSSATRLQREAYHDEVAKGFVLLPTPRYAEASAQWEASIRLLRGLIGEQPGSRPLWDRLINRHFNLCLAHRKSGLLAEAEQGYRDFVAAVEERNRAFGQAPADRAELALVLRDRALVQRERTMNAEADANLKRAIEVQRGVIADEPRNPSWRQRLCMLQLSQGDRRGMLATVGEWEKSLDGPQGQLHEAAWCLACALPGAGDAKLEEELSRESVRLLNKARAHGFKDAKFLERPEFNPLRNRNDFKATQ